MENNKNIKLKRVKLKSVRKDDSFHFESPYWSIYSPVMNKAAFIAMEIKYKLKYEIE